VTIRLVIEDEAGTRSTVPFTGDEITVGRAEDVTFRLADRDVSRRHARFVRASGAVLVEDLGSLTGTRVNGERITGRRRLREGDLVQIGDYDLAVFGEPQAGVPGEPPPLPPTPRPPTAADDPVQQAAAPEPVAAAPLPPTPTSPAAAPSRSPGTGLLRLLLVGAISLALGAAAGWAVGIATAPPKDAPPALTRP
jgi:predicted component of type VI protein secretion system